MIRREVLENFGDFLVDIRLHGCRGSDDPVEVLEGGREIGSDQSLQFVSLGNVPGHAGENTYYPNCGGLLVETE